MLEICFALALAVLLITVGMAYSHRRQFDRVIPMVLIGLWVMIAVLIFPVYRQQYGTGNGALFSFFYALRSLIANQDDTVLSGIGGAVWLQYGYRALGGIAFILAPVFTTGFLLSFFGNLSDKLRYALLGGQKLHIFSQLDENSVLLCESLAERGERFVFCNTEPSFDQKDSELVRRARKIGAVLLDASELDLKLRKKQVWLYQINSNKDYNINTTLALIEKHRKDKSKHIRIATFATGVTAELLLDSIPKGNIRVKLMDEVKYSCYQLLDQAPLFEGLEEGQKDISVLLVGCGDTGMELLKAMVWCGQMVGYSLKINVVDQCADKREKEFLRLCPDISLEEYHIRFITADVRTSDFTDILDRECQDTTYAVVSTGDDEVNIDTAVYLRRYFLCADKQAFSRSPKICLRVIDSLKSRQIDSLSTSRGDSYGFATFGSPEQIFRADHLTESPLEKLAIGVHLAYFGVLRGTGEEKQEAMRSYFKQEFNQRSSFATALHIKYKLFACGIKGISGKPVTEEQIKEFEEKMKDSKPFWEEIAELEHRRWNAFVRTEGFSTASVGDVRAYFPLTKYHVHYFAKLHPTLVEWKDLDRIGEELEPILGKKRDFKESDFDIVKQIPDILRLQSADITYWE